MEGNFNWYLVKYNKMHAFHGSTLFTISQSGKTIVDLVISPVELHFRVFGKRKTFFFFEKHLNCNIFQRVNQ